MRRGQPGNGKRKASVRGERRKGLFSETAALEPRIMFDGAMADTAAKAFDALHAGTEGVDATGDVFGHDARVAGERGERLLRALNENGASAPAQMMRHEIAFIDPRVGDVDALLAQMPDYMEVVFLDPEDDGVEQIAEILHGREEVDAVHIFSHGRSGTLDLGTAKLTAASMSGRYADDMAVIRDALAGHADILVYGCDFAKGARGRAAVEALAQATGADVAASDDLTGAARLGGDWDLEERFGLIETTGIAALNYDGVLAPVVISAANNSLSVVDASNNPVSGSGGAFQAGVGYVATWSNAGTVGGQPVDVKATVLSVGPGDTLYFEDPSRINADDLSLLLYSEGTGNPAEARVRWELVLAGTNISASGDIEFILADIDGIGGNPHTRETVAPDLHHLTAYGHETPTNLVFNTAGGALEASGTQNQNGEPSSAAIFTWTDVSSWEITYQVNANSLTPAARTTHDGDGDMTFANRQDHYLLGIDADGNDSTAAGNDFVTTFTENGPAVAVVDTDVDVFQHNALGTTIDEATVVLTNPQIGDELLVNGSNASSGTVNGLNYTITSSGGQITVALSGAATPADYEAALQAITFNNTTDNPATVDRTVDITVKNNTYGTTSNHAISTIHVTPVNDPPAGTDNTLTASEDTPYTFSSPDFGFTDVDGNNLRSVTITSLPDPAEGTLALYGNPVTAGQVISASDLIGLTFTPAANVNGNGLGAFTFQVTDDGGTANGGQDTDPTPNTINFNIAPVNDPPVAGDDGPVTVYPGTTVNIDVLDNDSDIENDPLSVTHIIDPATPATPLPISAGSSVTLASGTVVTLKADGTLDVTPAQVNADTEAFDYVISDSHGGTATATVTLAHDHDHDGIADSGDIDDDNDGILDVNEAGGDTDGDGVVDKFDLDSDNDGIADLIESGAAASTVALDTDHDGRLSVAETEAALGTGNADADNDGLMDVFDADPNDPSAAASAGTTPVNTDGTGPADFLDLDSDDDGIPDAVEARPTSGYVSSTHVNNAANDGVNDDGLYQPVDSDGDGTPDYIDANSDTDALSDAQESGLNPGADGNGDGIGDGINASYADPDGDVNNPSADLANQYGDTTEVAYREDNTPPSLTNDADGSSGAPAGDFEDTYTENDPAIHIVDTDAAVSDLQENIVEMVVTLSDGKIGDTIQFPSTLPGGISASVAPVATLTSPGTMTVTFTGNAATTNADWDSVLHALTFLPSTNNVHNPDPADRHFTIQLTDAANATSNVTHTTIHVVPVNDPPTLDLDDDNSGGINAGNYHGVFTEDGGPVPIHSNLVITDLDDTNLESATVTLTNPKAGDQLTVSGNAVSPGDTGTLNGISWAVTSGGSGEPVITLTGSAPIADYDAALEAIGFNNTSDDPDTTQRDISVVISDGDDNSAVRHAYIDVVAVNDAPGIDLDGDDSTATGAAFEDTYTENDPGHAVVDTDFAITDPDDTNMESATIVLTNAKPGDVLEVGSLPAGITANVDTSTPGQITVTLSGTASKADYEAAVKAVSFRSTSDDPDAADRIIHVSVNDGDADSNVAVTTMHVIPVNDPPVIDLDGDDSTASGSAHETTWTENGAAISMADVDLDVTDVDDSNIESATIVLTNAKPGDVIAVGALPGGITAQVNTGIQGQVTVTLSGSATLADYEAALSAVTFRNTSENPDQTPRIVTFTVNDGDSNSNTATATINVVEVNDPPVVSTALADQTSTDGNSSFTVATAGNFSDVDDPVTYSLGAGAPSWLQIDAATGVISVNGAIPHDASQHTNISGGTPGAYDVTVIATDPDGASAQDTFQLTISNLAPMANDDASSADEGTTQSGNVLSDASTGDSDTAPDSDPLTVTAVSGGPIGQPIHLTHGDLTLNADGSWTFVPNATANALADGESAQEQVTYTISDGEGGTDTATLTINITGSNDAPVVVDPTNPGLPGHPNPAADPANVLADVTAEDSATPASVDASVAFADPDSSDTLTYSATNLPAGLSIDPNTGVISGTIDHSASQGGDDPVNAPGVYTVTVTATDPHGATADTTITYTVTNPAPDAQNDALSTDEDTVLNASVFSDNGSGADADPDGDAITVSQVAGSAANVGQAVAGSNGGRFTINADGTLSFDPNGDFNDLAAGESRTTTVDYEISDGEGGVDTATVTVMVTGVNDAPVVVDPANPGTPGHPNPAADPANVLADVTTEDSATPASVDASVAFADPDGSDVLTYSATNLPAGLSIDPHTGVISGTIDHSASQGGDDPVNAPGVYTVTVTATDPHGATADTTITYTVTNPAPDAQNDALSTDEDTVLNASVFSDNGSGADADPDGDAITVSQVAGSAANVGQPVAGSNGGRFTINADGTLSFDPNGDFNDLAAGESRTTTVDYEISDGEGGVDTATVTVTVTGVNDAPVVVDPTNPGTPGHPNPAADPANVLADVTTEDSATPASVDASVAFADPDGSDVLTYSATNLPAGLAIDPHTGVISGTIDHSASQGGDDPVNAPGVYTVTVTATDPHGATADTTITYTVSNVPPVVLSRIPDTEGTDGRSVEISTAQHFADADGDGLTFSASGLPAGLSIDPSTGVISGNLAADASHRGPYVIVVTADDGQGGRALASFTLEAKEEEVTTPDKVAQAGLRAGDETNIEGNRKQSEPNDAGGVVLDTVEAASFAFTSVLPQGASLRTVINDLDDLHGVAALAGTGPISETVSWSDRGASGTGTGDSAFSRLVHGDDRAGNVQDGYRGYSLALPLLNGADGLRLETLMTSDGALLLRLERSDGRAPEDLDIVSEDGGPLPAYMWRVDASSLLVNIPAGAGKEVLQLRQALADGSIRSWKVRLDLHSGELKLLAEERSASTFSEQVERTARAAERAVEQLLIALAE